MKRFVIALILLIMMSGITGCRAGPHMSQGAPPIWTMSWSYVGDINYTFNFSYDGKYINFDGNRFRIYGDTRSGTFENDGETWRFTVDFSQHIATIYSPAEQKNFVPTARWVTLFVLPGQWQSLGDDNHILYLLPSGRGYKIFDDGFERISWRQTAQRLILCSWGEHSLSFSLEEDLLILSCHSFTFGENTTYRCGYERQYRRIPDYNHISIKDMEEIGTCLCLSDLRIEWNDRPRCM